ncbi:MAG: D-2-hydroxyacid dehydrogenase, partial [Pseudomonadota bacterium]|nr:D-2-hydroxyacid dehydrogenase [Pseudomonadota bacterium]
MHKRDELRRIVVIYDRPKDIQEYLAVRFPDIQFFHAVDAEEVRKQLAENEPEVIFSIKTPTVSPVPHHQAANFPSVRWVHVGGSGYEHLGSWDPARTVVTHSAGVLAPYLAETVTGAMLALNGNFLAYAEQQSRRKWRPLAFRPLAGQVMLVVGLGQIGGHVASNAQALGMHVIGIRKSQLPHPAVNELYRPEALREILPRADVVSVHLRLSKSTRYLIDSRAFAVMKPGAIFINTSRGAVVDEAALVSALRDNRLAGT